MCKGCWQEYGSPQIDNDKVREVARLVRVLYRDLDQTTGGMLHVQLDDFNIEDHFWTHDDENPQERVFAPYLITLHERQPFEVEWLIVEQMAALSEIERASALALADGYWGDLPDRPLLPAEGETVMRGRVTRVEPGEDENGNLIMKVTITPEHDA